MAGPWSDPSSVNVFDSEYTVWSSPSTVVTIVPEPGAVWSAPSTVDTVSAGEPVWFAKTGSGWVGVEMQTVS